MARRDLKVTELDFDQIKTNFRNFLKTQTEYSDYNFDSSAFDTLLDVFAYNTHYNAFYINSAINESFLTTAQQRKNLTKAARSLDYIPKSRNSASISVDLTIVIPQNTLVGIYGSTTYGTIQLNRRNRFTTTIDNNNYTFMNLVAENLSQGASSESGCVTYENFTITDVTLRQGEFTTFKYTIDTTDDNQRFIIPSANIDTSTLTISGVKSGETDSTTYTSYKGVSQQDIDGTTYVYFLFENSDGEYEFRFGDGVYGRAPDNNEVITIEYLNCSGSAANGANAFTASSSVLVSGNIITDATITASTSARSTGGAEKETDESIRSNAPISFKTQDRAVVVDDFGSLIQGNFTNVETTAAWGGEDNDPPRYGQVFIAVKPSGSDFLTDTEKSAILAYIKTKMVGSVRATIANPQYINIVPTITVKFDSKKTTITSSDLKDLIIQSVADYSTDNLQKFNTVYYNSQIIDIINDLDNSIQSISIDLKMRKQFVPTIGSASSYVLSYQNAFYYPHSGHLGSISSTTFTYDTYTGASLKLNSSGGLSINALVGDVDTVIVENAGTVDQTAGEITISDFNPSAVTNNLLKVDVKPDSDDISSTRDYIVRVKEEDITLTISDITSVTSLTTATSSGTTTGGSTVSY